MCFNPARSVNLRAGLDFPNGFSPSVLDVSLTALNSDMKDVEIKDASTTDAQQPSCRWRQEGSSDPERPHRADAARAKGRAADFISCSRTSAHITPDPTLFLPPPPLRECRTLRSHVDPRWLQGWLMASEKGVIYSNHVCECEGLLPGRPLMSPLRFFLGGCPSTSNQFFFCFFFLQWETFGLLCLIPLRKEEKKKKKSLCFWFCSPNERVLKKINSRRNKGRAVGCFSVVSSISVMTEAFPWSVLHESSLEQLCSVFLCSQP